VNDNFNASIEEAIFCVIDEAELESIKRTKRLSSILKEIITEPVLSMRRMRTDAYMAPSYVNLLLLSNEKHPAEIQSNDRRFNVAERQERQLNISDAEVKQLRDELPQLLDHLYEREVTFEMVRKPYNTRAAQELKSLSSNTSDETAELLLRGDFEFLVDNMPQHETPADLAQLTKRTLPSYASIIKRVYQQRKCRLTRDELATVYFYLCDISFPTPNKFTKFLNHKGVRLEKVRIDGAVQSATQEIEWQIPEDFDINLENGSKIRRVS